MNNTRRTVEKFIDQDAAIKRDLKRDIINKRALARYIKKKLNITKSIDAVISAIRRYPLDEVEIKDKSFPRDFKLSMKNEIFDLSLSNNPSVHERLSKLPQLIDFSRGETLRIIVGVQSIKVIGDERNLKKINKKFKNENILNQKTNLSEITLTFPKDADERTGIVSRVTNELTLNDINLAEIMSSAPELIIVIKEKDSIKAYKSLTQMKKEELN
ncbi:MAG: ACT domain containing protein [Candidatus Methanohalarchaeum thermophilum]|uniref:ACT domain containing protein n=1 Tax=Methanohalarchaeum thermophilum TaxID=1903181 RepID=A0A1Q6DSA4_METT1|nr:MAG: ACT domain containing protein [Candidatus Methanohalarchaeum thermophilum]